MIPQVLILNLAIWFVMERGPLFEEDIRPILKAHCLACHGEGEKVEGQLDLRLVRRITKGGESGPAIVSGSREESLLFRRIASGEMPPAGHSPLTPEQRERIGQWIDGGARTLRPEPDDVPVSGITPEDRAFWSFQSLSRPAIPEAPDSAWAHNPIDQFILARLASQGLNQAKRAAPRELLRRLSFALLGLPPTCQDVDEFTSNPSEENYARLVDRYLASPHFGERWARVWLDLCRYADETPNYLASAERAWLYRDWVIRYFNADRPYDEFVLLQLAADALPDIAPDDLAALGFLGLSPTYWKELRLAPEIIQQIVADEWDERIDAVSRTFLGLTVSCARCHDHKYDPITLTDYYALAGIFASTQLAERPLLPDPWAEAVRLARATVSEWEARRQAIKDPTSDIDRELQDAIARLRQNTPHYDEPWAHVVEDAFVEVVPLGDDQTRLVYQPGRTQDIPLFRRGNPADAGPVVPRRFLAVLSAEDAPVYREGSGRRELAQSMLREGRGLAARVIVNRVWAQLFDRGLVRTTSDFGRQGERPTHPELLEYLACRLVEQGWSLKGLIREIVLSATFQQTSYSSEPGKTCDPENRWLWRMNRRRLDVEAWRDGLLSALGTLDTRLYGPASPLSSPGFYRRTIYGKVVREELETMLRLYDFPEAVAHSPAREPTTTPLQQLFVLNGPLLSELAGHLAQRVLTECDHASQTERIEWCYRGLLQRSPTAQELDRSLAFLKTLSDSGQPPQEIWRAYAQVLLGLNEMLFLD